MKSIAIFFFVSLFFLCFLMGSTYLFYYISFDLDGAIKPKMIVFIPACILSAMVAISLPIVVQLETISETLCTLNNNIMAIHKENKGK